MSVPPYGSGDAGLETIFDIKHLKKNAYFLDTQCKIKPRLLYRHLSYFVLQTVSPFTSEVLSRRMSITGNCARGIVLRITLA